MVMAADIGSRREMRSLMGQILLGRWFMVFASFLIMFAAGAPYMFGLYSNEIKTSLGYDQTTLNLISFFLDVGTNVGVLAGLVNEVTPLWVGLIIGAIMNIGGYLMIWLSVKGSIPKPQVWQMCVYICIAANSQAFANTSTLVPCVKNFPERRGVILGLLKGYVGIGGAIMTQIYYAVYGANDPKALILLMAWLPAVIYFAFIPTIRLMKVARQSNELKVFYNFLYLSFILATSLMILIILQNYITFNRPEYVVSGAVVLVLLFLPLVVVIKEEVVQWKKKKQLQSLHCHITVEKSTVVPPPSTKPEVSCFSNVFRPPDRGEDYTILQALVSLDMLILFMATICGVGGTLTAINNLGQIALSLGYPSRSTSTFVSLVSIWNYLGRIVAGFVSEILLKKYKFPRPLMITLVLLLACVGHLLIAFGVSNGLYFASVIIGFCYGAMWPLLFGIISELFGLLYYSTLYNFGSVASPIGLYALNVRLAGSIYDKEARKQMAALGLTAEPGKALNCTGVECYKLSFIIIAAVTLFGCAISYVLVLRTRKFYQSDIYSKFREAEVATGTELSQASNGIDNVEIFSLSSYGTKSTAAQPTATIGSKTEEEREGKREEGSGWGWMEMDGDGRIG